jgi:hypothetical protein
MVKNFSSDCCLIDRQHLLLTGAIIGIADK